ncbi:MAG TPA: DUF6531 domain-containing protein [Methylobacter sp.]|jgi:YD repeat-containing protein
MRKLLAAFLLLFSSASFADSYLAIPTYYIPYGNGQPFSDASAACNVYSSAPQAYNGLFAPFSVVHYANGSVGCLGKQNSSWGLVVSYSCPAGGNYNVIWANGFGTNICSNAPACPQKRNATTGICELPSTPAIIPLKNTGKPPCGSSGGNPINIGTGNKYQPETDYQGAGDFPLVFQRTYNSDASTVSERLGTGSGWRHSYERSITSVASSSLATAYRADGSAYDFTSVGNNWSSTADVNLKLSRSASPDTWLLTTEDGSVETYNATGKLQSIKSRSGATQTLTYDANGLLTAVTHANGRSLTLSYDSNLRVATLQDPAGGLYRYGYNNNTGNLETATYRDQTTRTYLYNESANVGVDMPHALTGIIDENNHRFATFQYDNQKRAVSTQHAGGAERVSVAYGSNSNTVTDALGTARTHRFQTLQGVVKSIGSDQPAGAGCSAAARAISYDANGNVASRTDFNGNRTNYSYDLTRNLETSRTEGLTSAGATTPATRTITIVWHSTFRLPVQITNGNQQTSYAYNSQGDLTEKTVKDLAANTARSWSTTYTYSSIPGVLLQKVEDGPRTDVSDVTTYDYYPADAVCQGGHLGCRGQLKQLTDALGHLTQLTRYNAHGQIEQLTDSNGLVTTLTYDPRQRLTSLDAGGETTAYAYDPAGQLTRVTRPDGAYLAYSYDAAHRLIKTQDDLGNTLSYTLDAMGNRIKEEAYDPGGQLARSQSRVYDALSRLQNLILPQ